MKKILYSVAFLLAASSSSLIMYSCSDALDITQPGEIDDAVVFTSVSNLNDFLIGSVYANLEPATANYLTAVLTDEVKPGKGSGGQEYQLHRFFLTAEDGLPSTIWLNNYTVINRVNRLLEGAAKITPGSPSETAQYNNVIAQARAIRAYSYLQLETYFSTDMKNPSALGVLLVNDVPKTDSKLPRSSNQQIYDFMNADLDFARNTLGYSSDRYYVDKGFVNAVSARLNLYNGNIALAGKYAQAVLDGTGLMLTPAIPIITATAPVIGTPAWNTSFYATGGSFNPYRNVWNDTARGEVITALNRLPTGPGFSVGTYWNTNDSNLNGNSMWYWGRNLFNLFNKTGDVRKYAYVDPTSLIDPNYSTSTSPINTDALVIDKYPGKTSSTTRNDIKLFRVSEMYFILAEAAVEATNLPLAASYIQRVRVARSYDGSATTPAYDSPQIAYADILKERRIELALEGHRYIDLKRLAVKAGVTMDRNPTDDIVAVSNLANGSYKYTLPIPLSETSPNPNAQQNPGY